MLEFFILSDNELPEHVGTLHASFIYLHSADKSGEIWFGKIHKFPIFFISVFCHPLLKKKATEG
jgi:hypothetical protein